MGRISVTMQVREKVWHKRDDNNIFVILRCYQEMLWEVRDVVQTLNDL